MHSLEPFAHIERRRQQLQVVLNTPKRVRQVKLSKGASACHNDKGLIYYGEFDPGSG